MAITLRLVKGLPLTFAELDGNFVDLLSRATTLDERVDILEPVVISLDTRMDTAESDIDTLDGRLDDAETDINTLEDRVDALELSFSGLNASQVDYNNTTTGLAGDDVQEALDQIWALTQNRVTTNTAQSLTAPKRSAVLVDNDGSFDFAVSQNFICTPTGAVTLQFTISGGLIVGQSGFIKLYNPSGYTIAAASAFDFDADFLTTISAPGDYLISYFAESNTKVNLVVSAALT